VSTQRPLKYENGEHRPFDDDDTVPPETVPGSGFAATFFTCAGRAQVSGAAIPLCAEMHAAIEQGFVQALARLVAGTGIAITVRVDGTYLLSNICCDQSHVEF
jgi:hypothetical protein